MDDLKEAGFWIVIAGFLATLTWNGLNYLRNPTFVRRARLDEVLENVTEMRTELSELRAENIDLKSQVRRLMAECEFWRDQYRELKASSERGAGQ